MFCNLKRPILKAIVSSTLFCGVGFYAHGISLQEKDAFLKKHGYQWLSYIVNNTSIELELGDLLRNSGKPLADGASAGLPDVDCTQTFSSATL